MRVIFSVVGLLIAVAIVCMLAKKQLQAVQPAAGSAASQPVAGGAPAQLSRQLQGQVRGDVGKALDQGAQRADAESNR